MTLFLETTMTRQPGFLTPTRSSADPFAALHQQMNHLFDDFMGSNALPSLPSAMALPRMDVRESSQEICISTDLPGVNPADVEVRLDGNMLTLRGEKRQEHETQQPQDYHLMERSWGRFQRSLQLPFAPESQEINADFAHGVLTIRIPKHALQERSHRIAVHSHELPSQSAAVSQGGGSAGRQIGTQMGEKAGGHASAEGHAAEGGKKGGSSRH
jgi:HSP20 family protein